MTFGAADNLVGATLAGFDLSTAQALFNVPRHYDTISVLAAPGADTVRLQLAIAKVLPPGVQVVSGETVASELSSAVNNALSFISTALLIFAFISLFVGGFTIFNTFSITVGQRTRELALLRVVGASRRQVFRSVLGEAAVDGTRRLPDRSGLGVLAALGLKALLKGVRHRLAVSATGVRGPHASWSRSRSASGSRVLSAIIPARRAVRIAPVAALRGATHEEHGGVAPAAAGDRRRRRRVAGGVARCWRG